MENILHQRLKGVILIGLLLFAAASYFLFFKPPQLDKKNIEEFALKRIQLMERKIAQRSQALMERARELFELYRKNDLQHPRLEPKEALIIEENGRIKRYFGEIYHFRLLPLEPGDRAFIDKNNNIYFLYKLADHIFYTRFFCPLEDNDLLKYTSFALSELKFSKIPLLALENKYIYDNLKNLISYYHLLANSNDQLFLHLKFSKKDVEYYYKKKEKIFFLSLIGFFCLLGILFGLKKKNIPSQILWLAFLVDIFWLISLLTARHNNLYLKFKVLNFNVKFHSLYQMLIFSLFILSVLFFLRGRFRKRNVAYLLFNLMLLLMIKSSDIIYKGCQFNYLEFGWDNFVLIFITFLLYLISLIFIIEGAAGLKEELKTSKGKFFEILIFLGIQVLFFLIVVFILKLAIYSFILVSLAAFILLFFKRGFFSRTVILFILAVSIFQLAAGHSLRERQEFIEYNLKNIFLNQGNYAKFIAREIIHEINLSRSNLNDFYEFFEGNTSSKLEAIWRRTIASRENIASGIFVVSKENEVLSYFAYQIPFFKVRLRNIFPFWAMEDTTAEIHGREIPLAAAYISIFKEWDYLGRIMVLVYNSPGLLLRYQDKVNIFTIDNKIDGRDLSFIKVGPDNQIIENPSNLNLENIAGILTHHNQWVKFNSMDMAFEGYIFRYGGNAIIIFFPLNTFFNNFAGVIKVFIFLSLLAILFYMKGVKNIDWKSLYYSFSIRVFAILIVISLFTAIVFSVFFINFSSQTSEQKIVRLVYENGRTAQNIAYDLIKDRTDFSRDYLFSLSDILNSDISVYQDDGVLVETSNYRKIINSQIPDYLHSQILNRLNEKNQKFVLFEEKESFYLFFKVYDYIFMSQFSNKWENVLSEQRYYTDFIISMFFCLIIIGFSAAFFFRNKILSPIDGLNQGMAEVERGNLPKLAHIPSEIELKNLYLGFNNMIEGIREQKRAISEMSQMKTIIRLGRRVAHEVKNPLTPIKLSAEQILKVLKDKNPGYEKMIIQSVNYIIDETEHLKRVSYGFLDLSRLDEIDVEAFDLVELAREELFNVTQVYSKIQFEITVDTQEEDQEKEVLKVTLDRIKIKQVLKNLITNAIDAIGDKKGKISINLKRNLQNGCITVEVADNGIGMDDEEFDRAFEADYSTKEIGTGLGLFIVKRIVELHKGRIKIHSEKHKGTRVVLELPENAFKK